MNENVKSLVDLTSLSTVIGTLMGLLPNIAAFFTIVWTGLRIYYLIKEHKVTKD